MTSTTGTYAVSLYLEDFLDGSSTPRSSVALQFLVIVQNLPLGCTTTKPSLISPSPADGSEIMIQQGTTYTGEIRGSPVDASTP